MRSPAPPQSLKRILSLARWGVAQCFLEIGLWGTVAAAVVAPTEWYHEMGRPRVIDRLGVFVGPDRVYQLESVLKHGAATLGLATVGVVLGAERSELVRGLRRAIAACGRQLGLSRALAKRRWHVSDAFAATAASGVLAWYFGTSFKRHRDRDAELWHMWSKTSELLGVLSLLAAAGSLVPATRRSFVLHALGVPYEAVVWMHRWAGRGAAACGLAHLGGYLVLWLKRPSDDGGVAENLWPSGDGNRQRYVAWRNLYGVFALAGMLAMGVFARAAARRPNWRRFRVTHRLWIPSLLCVNVHFDYAASYLAPALALYLTDAAAALLESSRAATVLSARRLPGDVAELVLAVEPGARFAPGQWISLALPSLAASRGLLPEAHPFTVSSAPERARRAGAVTVHARGGGAWTSALCEACERAPFDAGPARLSGFYGPDLAREIAQFSPVLLVAGGIGITPFLSVLESRRVPACALLWAARDAAPFFDALGAPLAASASEQLSRCEMHCTGAATSLTPRARCGEGEHQEASLLGGTASASSSPVAVSRFAPGCRTPARHALATLAALVASAAATVALGGDALSGKSSEYRWQGYRTAQLVGAAAAAMSAAAAVLLFDRARQRVSLDTSMWTHRVDGDVDALFDGPSSSGDVAIEMRPASSEDREVAETPSVMPPNSESDAPPLTSRFPVQYGRPDLHAAIERLRSEASGMADARAAVFVCGPPSLCCAVWDAAQDPTGGRQRHVEFRDVGFDL